MQKRKSLCDSDTGMLMNVGEDRLCVFMKHRIKEKSIEPYNPYWHVYELTADPEAFHIHKFVKKDKRFGGTLLTKTPFEFDNKQQIDIPLENISHIGNVNVCEFMVLDNPENGYIDWKGVGLIAVSADDETMGYSWDGMIPIGDMSYYNIWDIPFFILHDDKTETQFEPKTDDPVKELEDIHELVAVQSIDLYMWKEKQREEAEEKENAI